jgi:hypothetical protein
MRLIMKLEWYLWEMLIIIIIIAIIIKFKSDLRTSHLKYSTDLSTKHRTKGKVFPVHSIKAYKGRRGISPLILNLGTLWRWVVNFMPHAAALPQYPLYRRMVGPQTDWTFWGRGKYLASAGIRTLDHPARRLDTTPSTLPQSSRHYTKYATPFI